MGLKSKIKKLFFEKTQVGEFKQQPSEKRQIVFHAESKADWNYLGPIVEELSKRGEHVSYLTSDKDDPILEQRIKNVSTFYVGLGTALTVLYKTIDCRLFITSLPDLETFHLKRSVNNVTYVYVFHNMGSTHALYREEAFDNFDVILTVGPHHEKEIRKREELFGLKEKMLLPHGNGRLDSLIREATNKNANKLKNDKVQILVASSWGPSSITDRCAIPLVRLLLDAGMVVTYRPHPMSQWHATEKLDEIKKAFSEDKNFSYETDIRESKSLQNSNALITEWSGIALEYAFTYGRPVYSIDTPRKVNNENYKALGLETLESSIRKDIGTIIPEKNLNLVVDEIRKDMTLKKNGTIVAEKLRNKHIYNVGKSGSVAADYIQKLNREKN